MSLVIETMDLTLYGCPMHYIKAREALRQIEQEHTMLFVVNNGDAVEDVLISLRNDGQDCEIDSQNDATTTIRVTKRI